MGDFILTLDGAPKALSNLKLRSQLEKTVPKGLISAVERQDDGSVILKFIREQDLRQFRNENITTIEFGNEKHWITIREPVRQSPVEERRQVIPHKWDDDPWRRKLFVTNIPRHLDSRQALTLHFEKFGRVESCFLHRNGFAYVLFAHHLDALAALYRGRAAGPNFYLKIVWDRKEVGGPSPGQPQPLMSIQGARPEASRRGQRRSSSKMDLRESEIQQLTSRKQKTPLKSVADKAEDFYKSVHYWSTFKELPANEGTLCVLASNIDDSASLEKVEMHFKLKKRSNGGMVTNIIRMIDGLLIIFQNPKDCENCLEMKEQEFCEAPLIIFPKKIPTYFERKFIVEGVGAGTSVDTLTMFLEQCSARETSPYACIKLARSGIYLIEYGDDFEPSEASEIILKIKGQRLEEKKLEARRLLRTDCLKITGIEGDISSDQIRLKLESKKRSAGGPITRVDFLKNKAVLVYFADFEDAERVYERFKKQSEDKMVIGGHVVEVELYFHALAKDHMSAVKQQKKQIGGKEEIEAVSAPKLLLKTCDIKPGCKVKLLVFIQSNHTHLEKLQTLYTDFATVKILPWRKGMPAALKCVPSEKAEAESQVAFETECRKRFNEFLSSYSSASLTFDEAKLNKARKSKLSSFIDKDYKGDGCNIVVSWKNLSVEVSGIDKAVKNFTDQIKTALEFTARKMGISDEQYRILTACGIVEELQQKYATVNIECDDKTLSITLTGSNDDLNIVQIEALTVLNTIEKRKVSTVNAYILTYLSEMKDSSYVRAELYNKFKLDDVKVLLTIDDDGVYLRVRTDADYKRAVVSILSLVKVETVEIDEATNPVVQSPMWNGFKQSLRGIDPCIAYVKERKENGGGKEIIAVGIQSHIQEFRRKIVDFLDDNATRHFCLQMPYGSAKFIVEKCKDFSADACRRRGIKCRLTPQNGGGVAVTGKKKALEAVRPQMIQIMHKMKEVTQTMSEPGIMQYYQGEEGKEFLKMTERANNCIILESRSCPEWEREGQRRRTTISQRASSSPSKPKEQRLACVTLPNSNVSLQVWKGNIIEHNCDVIVNASNPELQLLPSGVSGVIKKLDSKNGNMIQAEMRKLIGDNYGSFLSGDAIITTAGNLPNCQHIVHAVGPKWHAPSEKDPSKALKACIFNSLEEASRARMTSIAIPAISCGVFGGQVSICIPLILEAVTEYFKEKLNTFLTRVDFIENQKQEVLDAFTKSVKGIVSHRSAQQAQQQTPAQSDRNPFRVKVSHRTSSVNVQLCNGDLSKIKADVIVNITSSKGFPSMSGSSISASLLQAGGSAIAAECQRYPGPHNLGSVIRTSGGALACRELFHGIVSKYDQNSEQIIKAIVSQCLRNADSAGYSSIAFPAIATGGFRHPADKVARWMNEEISNYSPTNLKNVTTVLWPKDTSTIAAFQAEFNQAPNPSSSIGAALFGTFQSLGQSGGNFGAINVDVYQGDITQETSDAIVNSIGQNFNLSKGMVANAILSQGGPQIQAELWNETGNDCRSTTGGNLPCQTIIHVVTPGNEKDIIKKVEMVLEVANQQGITSISFPALATGNIGMSSSVVAHSMRKAFEKFAKSHPNASVATINVVVFDQSKINDFKKGILSSEQSIFGKVKESISSFFGKGSTESERKEEQYDLYLYSTDDDAINKARAAIIRETKKMVERRVIQDDAFGRLSEWEWWELLQVESNSNVKITNKSNNYLKQISVEGLTRDVMKACERIKDILKEFSEGETTATFVTWQKLVHGSWQDYQPRTATVLEKAYQTRNGNKTDARLNRIPIVEFSNGKLYKDEVDLSNLEGDTSGSNPPQIRRKVKEKASDDDVPSHWDPIPAGQPFLKVPLPQGSAEYQEAITAYTRTGGAGNIIKIERIQNVSLYKQYIAKKAEVKKKLTSGNPVERQLFHGTSDDDKIILQGFDRSYAGKNATVHGAGVYFALQASYSNGYASPNAQGHRRMFLANVITGDYCQGHSSFKAAPLKPGGTANDVYDSVVNHVNSPTVFIIFKDASAYPKFLITYT